MARLVYLVCALLHWSLSLATGLYARLREDDSPSNERGHLHDDRGHVTPEALVNTPWRKGAITWQERLLKSQKHILDLKMQAIDNAAFRKAASIPAVKARTDRVFVGAHMDGHVKAFEEKGRKVQPFMERGTEAYNEHTIVHQKTWDAAHELLRNQYPGRFAAHEFRTRLKGVLSGGRRRDRKGPVRPRHELAPLAHGSGARSASATSYHTAPQEFHRDRFL